MSRLIVSIRRFGPAAHNIRVNSGAYVPETDQTAQTDRDVEKQRKFTPFSGQKLTTRLSKLTSGPDQGRLEGLVA